MGGGASDGLIYINYTAASITILNDHEMSWTSGSGNSQMADDFVLDAAYTITGITWIGQDAAGPFNVVPSWNFLWYADDGGQPTGGGLSDATTTALHVSVEAGANVVANLAGHPLTEYTVELTTPIELNGFTTYWLAIQAVGNPTLWGMARSTSQQGFGAVSAWEGTIAYWDGNPFVDELGGVDHDLGFVLHGTLLPTPGTLALLSVAGLVISRRRRR